MSRSPRRAVTPAGAVLNYLYALAEFECRVALIAMGLDPGIGWAHRDTPTRDSAALDLLEVLRPEVDRFVLRLLAERTFSRREFAEMPDGEVPLSSILAWALTDATLLGWERGAGATAEDAARLVASGSTSAVSVRTRLTRTARQRGGTMRVGSTRLPQSCLICGALVDLPDRKVCDGCQPIFDEVRTERLASAGRAKLAEMRTSERDPARSPEALKKRAETSRLRMSAIRAWEREHGRRIDRQQYEEEVIPVLRVMTVPALMAATGLTQHYCWQVRAGRKRLNPTHWDRVLNALGPGPSG